MQKLIKSQPPPIQQLEVTTDEPNHRKEQPIHYPHNNSHHSNQQHEFNLAQSETRQHQPALTRSNSVQATFEKIGSNTPVYPIVGEPNSFVSTDTKPARIQSRFITSLSFTWPSLESRLTFHFVVVYLVRLIWWRLVHARMYIGWAWISILAGWKGWLMQMYIW